MRTLSGKTEPNTATRQPTQAAQFRWRRLNVVDHSTPPYHRGVPIRIGPKTRGPRLTHHQRVLRMSWRVRNAINNHKERLKEWCGKGIVAYIGLQRATAAVGIVIVRRQRYAVLADELVALGLCI